MRMAAVNPTADTMRHRPRATPDIRHRPHLRSKIHVMDTEVVHLHPKAPLSILPQAQIPPSSWCPLPVSNVHNNRHLSQRLPQIRMQFPKVACLLAADRRAMRPKSLLQDNLIRQSKTDIRSTQPVRRQYRMVQVALTILHNSQQVTLHSKAHLQSNHKDNKTPTSKSPPRHHHSNLPRTPTRSHHLKQAMAILHNNRAMHHLRRLLHRTVRHQLHKIISRIGRPGKRRVHRRLVLTRVFTGRVGRGLVWVEWESVHIGMSGAVFGLTS